MTAHETWAHHDDPEENVSPWNMSYIELHLLKKYKNFSKKTYGYSFWNANIVTCIDFFGPSTISTLEYYIATVKILK